jgi:hypothetical protein
MSGNRQLEIVGTDRRNGDRVLVEYSDNSTATYTREQLARLTPSSEEKSEGPLDTNVEQGTDK